jgi:hypothetical protein
MSHCWDCVEKPHCLCRGSGGRPCKYYIGPVRKESPDRSRESTTHAPHIWNLPAPAIAKVGETGYRHVGLSCVINYCVEE